MQTVIDIETTMRPGGDRRLSASPYIPENYLVSIGYKSKDSEEYLCFAHNERVADNDAKEKVTEQLRKTTLLIAHNVKFDLSWLLECGFEYDGDVYDTMIYEYLKAGGRPNIRVNLSACCSRRGLPIKKDVPKYYLKEGTGFEAMPWNVVEEYGRNDVSITWALYKAQIEEMEGDI